MGSTFCVLTRVRSAQTTEGNAMKETVKQVQNEKGRENISLIRLFNLLQALLQLLQHLLHPFEHPEQQTNIFFLFKFN